MDLVERIVFLLLWRPISENNVHLSSPLLLNTYQGTLRLFAKEKAKWSCYAPLRGICESMYSSYSLFSSTIVGVSSQHHTAVALYLQGKSHSTHYIRVWERLRASLDTEIRGKNFCLCRGSNPCSAVRSQTLC
jgi:hypothetical protein